MTHKEIERAIKDLRRGRSYDRVFYVIVIIIAIGFLMTIWDRYKPVAVNSNTNNNMLVAERSLDAVRERASSRGHYTREQFAELTGASYRTIQRYEDQGRLSPPPTRSPSGRVMIDLETKILPESGQ